MTMALVRDDGVCACSSHGLWECTSGLYTAVEYTALQSNLHDVHSATSVACRPDISSLHLACLHALAQWFWHDYEPVCLLLWVMLAEGP